jgi:hypothetical protein
LPSWFRHIAGIAFIHITIAGLAEFQIIKRPNTPPVSEDVARWPPPPAPTNREEVERWNKEWLEKKHQEQEQRIQEHIRRDPQWLDRLRQEEEQRIQKYREDYQKQEPLIQKQREWYQQQKRPIRPGEIPLPYPFQ